MQTDPHDTTSEGASPTTATDAESGGAAEGAPAPPPSRARRWGKVAAVVVVLGVGVAAIRYFELATLFVELADKVNALGFWAPVVYVLLYAVATVAFVPGSLLTLAAGVIFGLAKGGIVVFAGATIGSCAAFLVSRYLARGAIERRLAGNQRFAAIDRAIGERGLYITTLLRLSPIFPFNLLNYGLGLTKVRFRDYALASLGMIPGTILFVYYGVAFGSIAKILEGGPSDAAGGAADCVVQGLGLVAFIVVTVLITRTARRALKEATDESDGGEG